MAMLERQQDLDQNTAVSPMPVSPGGAVKNTSGTAYSTGQGMLGSIMTPPDAGPVDDMASGSSLDELRESAPPIAGATPGQAGMINPIEAVDATAGQTGDAAQAMASGAQASDAGAVQSEATGYNAMTGEVDPSVTAAGQLADITSQDSANMRRASQQGMLAAASRGLQNSSFAAGAAQGAMVDRATPLAQQDAATQYSNMRANLDAVNRAAEVSTGRETDVSMQNAQLGTSVNQQNAAMETEAAMQLAQLQTSVSQQNAAAQNELQALQAQMDTAVSQQNADAANRIQQQMADIQANINMRNAEMETAVSQFNADSVNRANLQVLQGNQELNRQYLAGTQAMDLADIQGRYQQLISSNQAAASIYNSYLTSIGQAMANHEVTPSRIAQYINVMSQQLEGSLELIDAMNSLDLGGVNVPGAVGSGNSIYPGAPGSIGPTPTPTAPPATTPPNIPPIYPYRPPGSPEFNLP